MDFSEALKEVKAGKKIARTNWNGNKLPGKSLFVYYVPAGNYKACTDIAETLVNEEGLVPYTHYLAIKSVDNTITPWVASQTDILADDWYIVED